MSRLQHSAADLGLPWAEWMQDWGIMNADPSRLAEFAAYYREHFDSFDWGQQCYLGELLFESANRAIDQNIQSTISPESVIDLILEHIDQGAVQFLTMYWRNLSNKDELPISALLNNLLIGEQNLLIDNYKTRMHQQYEQKIEDE